MSGWQGCRAVGEGISWQLYVGSALVCRGCLWAGGLGQCMRTQVWVLCKCDTDRRELRS